MNFFLKSIKNFLEFLITFLFCKCASKIPLNYIFGSLSSYLTFFSPTISSTTILFPISTIFYFFLNLFFFNINIFNKIPTIIFIFYFYILNNKKLKKYLKYIFIFSFIIGYFILINHSFGQKIYWYGFSWIISSFLLFFFEKNNFIKFFCCSWIPQMVGTLLQIYLSINFLPQEVYKNLILISIIERIILSIYLYYIFNFLEFLKIKINMLFFKKKFLIKNI